MIVIVLTVVAPPPSQKTIKGEVRQQDHINMVESGLLVQINNTNTSELFYTQTYGPPVMPGLYSTTIYASEGDVIYVFVKNDTDWGYVYGTMGQTQLDIDVNLNRSRASEAIVKIIVPVNNTLVNSSQDLNITANITIVGDDGISCQAILSFSDSGIIELIDGETAVHNLGDVNRGTTITEVWEVESLTDGVVNITVNASCLSDRRIFENQNTYTVFNITSRDVSPPMINLTWPGNNTKRNNPLLVFYDVDENSEIKNCTLSINDIVVNKTFAPDKSLVLNFSNLISAGENDIEINCTDDSLRENMGSSGIFNYTLNSFPFISDIRIEDPINLLAASNKTVYCNGTIEDSDTYLDIVSVNASLFFKDLTPESDNNRSTKYFNSSCTLLNPSGDNIEFACGFDVEYYANNGSWYCNASALDMINSTNSSEITTTVNDLIALSVTPVIDYYLLEPLQISPNDIASNITNYGNVPIDLSIYAYAQTDDDNLAMTCTKGQISYEYEKFSASIGQDFSVMQEVNNKLSPVFVDFNLDQKVFGATENSMKSLYWKLQIPFAADGSCNGKVVFSAVSNT